MIESVGNPHPRRRFTRFGTPPLCAPSFCIMLFMLTSAASAQTLQPHGKASQQSKTAATTQPVAPVEPVPTPILQQPPTQAEIETAPDTLTIHASNASLTQTLQRIADKTGMTIDGTTGDERVFGTFGPGKPRDVLNTLLNGTSYNVIMVGVLANGAPRQLLLSTKSAGSSPAAAPSQPAPTATDDDTPDTPPDDAQPGIPPPGRPGGGLGPGGQMPHNPQEMLQQMRQQQQQQQQAGQPQ